MDTDAEDMSLKAIELCRDFNRRMFDRQAQNGIAHADVAIAAIYSAVDVAAVFRGGIPAGLAWVRQALDVMEDRLRLHGDEGEGLLN